MFLPKETCSKREREQESAEAIVVRMPSESPAERRAEGTTAKRPGACGPETPPKRQQPEVGNHVALREPEPP